ncbi:RNA 3'-terminal phosphate cyclase [Carpediemonas membranifera]|uniref:RNA 3'-terminal phosphate cyclase n=1 Tax=Carpediemonas membranifera TaxID=201153 RepID=A0A8J6B215_9EUKA|nr:RNA 3'-terminal phosphate cyclase [Carpediemonas membranifera]|eukprot:KAG9391214.1 RNA 3'-terminal phosphate cyclase [Carpediemonas membranifera]
MADAFRYRVVLSVITKNPLLIPDFTDETQRVKPYEESFLNFVVKICTPKVVGQEYGRFWWVSGRTFHFNPPGSIPTVGGRSYRLHPSRTIAWYLEPVLVMLAFSSGEDQNITATTRIKLFGATHNAIDLSADVLQTGGLPVLKAAGIDGARIHIATRAVMDPSQDSKAIPQGEVAVTMPCVKNLEPIDLVNEGQVKRLLTYAWGIAANDLPTTAMATTNNVMRQYINADSSNNLAVKAKPQHSAGGYGVFTVTQTDAEVTRVAEASSMCFPEARVDTDAVNPAIRVGTLAARRTLGVIAGGGCVSPQLVPLALCLMALCPEVSKLRVGLMTPFIEELERVIEEMLHVTFSKEPGASGTTIYVTKGAMVTNINRQYK